MNCTPATRPTRKRILDRLRSIAQRNGDRIVTHRVDGSFYLVDSNTNCLVWPYSMFQIGTGATLAELRDYIQGNAR